MHEVEIGTGECPTRCRERFAACLLGAGDVSPHRERIAEIQQIVRQGRVGAAAAVDGDGLAAVGLGGGDIPEEANERRELAKACRNVGMRVAEQRSPDAKGVARERIRRAIFTL